MTYHNEAIDDNFLGVFHQREVAKVWFIVFYLVVRRRLQTDSRLLFVINFVAFATLFLDLGQPDVFSNSEDKLRHSL